MTYIWTRDLYFALIIQTKGHFPLAADINKSRLRAYKLIIQSMMTKK